MQQRAALTAFLSSQKANGNIDFCYEFFCFGLDSVAGAGSTDSATGNALTGIMLGTTAQTIKGDNTTINDISHTESGSGVNGGFNCIEDTSAWPPYNVARAVNTNVDLAAFNTAMSVDGREYSMGGVVTNTGAILQNYVQLFGIIDYKDSASVPWPSSTFNWRDEVSGTAEEWYEVGVNSVNTQHFAVDIEPGNSAGFATHDDEYCQITGFNYDAGDDNSDLELRIGANTVNVKKGAPAGGASQSAADEDIYPVGGVQMPGAAKYNISWGEAYETQSSLTTRIQFFCVLKSGYDYATWESGVSRLIADLKA
jgi:hypothetical protein